MLLQVAAGMRRRATTDAVNTERDERIDLKEVDVRSPGRAAKSRVRIGDGHTETNRSAARTLLEEVDQTGAILGGSHAVVGLHVVAGNDGVRVGDERSSVAASQTKSACFIALE